MMASAGGFGFDLRKRNRRPRVDRRRRLDNGSRRGFLDRLDVDGPALLTDVHRRSRTSTSLRHGAWYRARSEEHTSELQSRPHLVCRLLLEKKKNTTTTYSAQSNKKKRKKNL